MRKTNCPFLDLPMQVWTIENKCTNGNNMPETKLRGAGSAKDEGLILFLSKIFVH
jgi:hypothetical protein